METVIDLETADLESAFFQENGTVTMTSVSNFTEEPVGNEEEMSQHIPNVVQTITDMTEVEIAQELERSEPETSAYMSELHVISETNHIDTVPNISKNLETEGLKSVSKQGTVNGGGQCLLDANKTDISNIKIRKESLNVPIHSTPLKNGSRRESTISHVRKGSKFSLLSPVSRRSMQFKNDFMNLRMPEDEKNSVLQQDDSWIRSAIPYLPLWAAVLCLLLNILIPGSGKKFRADLFNLTVCYFIDVLCLLLGQLNIESALWSYCAENTCSTFVYDEPMEILVTWEIKLHHSAGGTVLSGLCILCCAKSRVPARFDQDPGFLVCVNTLVGIAQLFTVTFLLVGWFWGIAWGIKMVVLSLERRQELREQRDLQLKQEAVNAFGQTLMGKI